MAFATDNRREAAIERAKALLLQEGGEAGDSFKACSRRCGEDYILRGAAYCEFCERHVLQHDGSWIIQTLE